MIQTGPMSRPAHRLRGCQPVALRQRAGLPGLDRLEAGVRVSFIAVSDTVRYRRPHPDQYLTRHPPVDTTRLAGRMSHPSILVFDISSRALEGLQ